LSLPAIRFASFIKAEGTLALLDSQVLTFTVALHFRNAKLELAFLGDHALSLTPTANLRALGYHLSRGLTTLCLTFTSHIFPGKLLITIMAVVESLSGESLTW
jgi:hypothetical protein